LCVFELDVASSPPRILRANRASERVYGWPPAELQNAALETILPPDARSSLQPALKALSSGKTFAGEYSGLRRDGSEFPARLSVTSGAGREAGRSILVIEDITAEKERRSEEQAIAEERQRIAREIHDGLAQDLAGLRFQVTLWHQLVDCDPARMHAELASFQTLLAKNLREVRRSIFALRPLALDELGFFPALRQFIGEFAEQNQLQVDLRIKGSEESLPTFLELVLFRIIQESLHNISKHAQARAVCVILDLGSLETVKLTVRDDGVGFDLAGLEMAVVAGHLGLKQMQERVKKLGGSFKVHSQLGAGTEIEAMLPLAGDKGKRDGAEE
jgi:PAS domain S-box-containing protein